MTCTISMATATENQLKGFGAILVGQSLILWMLYTVLMPSDCINVFAF